MSSLLTKTNYLIFISKCNCINKEVYACTEYTRGKKDQKNTLESLTTQPLYKIKQ